MYYFPTSVFEPPVFTLFELKEEQIEIAIPRKHNNVFTKIAKFFAATGMLFLLISYGPSVWYFVRGSETVSNLLSNTVTVNALGNKSNVSSWQPSFDKSLSLENKIIIPSIGVETTINEAKDDSHEDALYEGVWRVNDFGTPYNRQQPTILAAHRFGYLSWSLDFRLHQSFYRLPSLKVGETLTIIWRQRKYTYAIYKSEENTEITDYSADLILYTCRDLSGDIREIKYARLIEQ